MERGKTMKEQELFRISMRGHREANWPSKRRARSPRNVCKTLSRCGQEAEQGVPYQNDMKIRLGLVNVNNILVFENYMMHKNTEIGAQADSMDCCRSLVEGLHGSITRCMVRCYRDRAIYGWGLPTQGCEFLKIERRSLAA
ncbi:hypothetical protein CRG98_005069 [Punica granatum]|uniref:Uncharacterized protein n=1 Tax=Punica granatum TaxID=22663 RepID=A0A2I0L1D6_PUNGR|nr:hypothetical protein CRG98_005069 [Punica granatum]